MSKLTKEETLKNLEGVYSSIVQKITDHFDHVDLEMDFSRVHTELDQDGEERRFTDGNWTSAIILRERLPRKYFLDRLAENKSFII